MTDIYGNEHYPHSRRLYSRPFSSFHASYERPHSQADRLRAALLDLGEELIGGSFDACADLSFVDVLRGRRSFWPFRSQEEAVSKSRGVPVMKMNLPSAAAAALDNVVKQVTQSAETEIIPGTSNNIRRVIPYDMPKLHRDFCTLWDADFMIDPRLTHVEELFMSVGDGAARKNYRYDRMDDGARLEATLRWMRAPDNAARVARAFLYSRLAQHFGETDSVSAKIAAHAASEIDAGRGDKLIDVLRHDPESLAAEADDTDWDASPLGYMFRKAQNLPDILNPQSLADTAARMVADYTRLKNGAWADAQLALCSPPAEQPKPVPPQPLARGIVI